LGPLYWGELDGGELRTLGQAVTSFAVHGRRIAWVEQGPTSAGVHVLDRVSGETRELTTTPHFARRIWHLDDEVVIWGDQGIEGQAFIELNTERLWVAEL
jgi:hypothetical protein